MESLTLCGNNKRARKLALSFFKKIKKFLIKLLTKLKKYVIINTEREKGRDTMINIRTLKKLNNNDGLTLKNGKVITYKSGWQVATEGQETADIQEAMMMIREYNGDCGVWYSEGIYYIDKSHRVNTKREAMEIGRQCNQISVLCWRTMGLAYC